MIYTLTGDNKVVEPDPLSEEFAGYAESKMEHYVFEFLLNYVRTSAGTGFIPSRSSYGRTGRNICHMIHEACTQCV